MPRDPFEWIVAAFGLVFTVAFAILAVPAVLQDGDIIGAFAAGFVNPYASAYAADVWCSGFILIAWALYERLPGGWLVVPLTFVPGVATAFAYYLILRRRALPREAA